MAENEPDDCSDVLSLLQSSMEPTKAAEVGRSALPEDLLVRVREELTCCLCLDLAARPATLPCGHSACRGCLTELFNMGRPDAERRCPACRAQFSAGTQPLQLNATLKCLAELLLPEECEERGRVPSPQPLPSRPPLRQRVLVVSTAGRRSVSMHTASDLTAAGMRAAHAGLRAMLDVLEDRWPELEDEGAQAQALPPQPNLIHQTVSPIRRPVSSAQERTPAAPAARQHAPGSARQHWAPRSRSQQAQRSPAASSPPPVRWRSARALDVRPSPARRPAHSNASPAPGPTAAAFGSPAEVDQSATAPASPVYVSEAAVPTGTAPTQSAAEPQAPPTAGAGAQAEHSPGPSAGGGGASTISPAPSTAARAGSARRGHQAGMSAGENSTTPAAAGTAAGQATRGRQAQQLAQNTGLAVPAAATGTGRSRGSITGRRSLSAPGVARNHTALPRWQH